MSLKKLFKFSPIITTGDIVQILLTILTVILTITLGIRYATNEVKESLSKQTQTLNAQILMLFPKLPVFEWHVGQVYPFDKGSSNVRIVAIDPARKEVEVQFTVGGSSRNVVLRTGQIQQIAVPGGGTYRFMLKDVAIRDGSKTAEFIVTEVKE